MDFSLMWHLWYFTSTLPLEVQLFSFIYDLVTYQGIRWLINFGILNFSGSIMVLRQHIYGIFVYSR